VHAKALGAEEAAALLRQNHVLNSLCHSFLTVEIAQDAEQREQRHKALLTIDNIKFTCRHFGRQAQCLRAGSIHQQDRAEKIVVVGGAVGAKTRRLKEIINELLDLLRAP
jgi:hypothetical protein